MKHFGDITKISGYSAPIVDCIIGGSPCQDLSVAGKRAGLDGERSGLYIEQVRIVKEMREQDERNGRSGVDVRPRYMVWENVPGAFSSNKGEDFRIVLEELAKVKDKDAVIPMPDSGKWTNHGCIVGDGWSIAWRVLDAQFWGVPQRRRRIALVADFGGESAPEILFVRKSVSGDTEPSKPKRQEPSSDASRGIGADDREGELPYTLKIRSGVSVDSYGKAAGKGALIQKNMSATLGVSQDQYLFQPIGFDRYNQCVTGEVSETLRTPNGGDNYPCVCQPITFEPGIASREGGHIYEGVSGTLRAHAGDNQMATAYGISSYDSNAMKSSNPDSGIYEAKTARTLDGNGGNPSCNQGGIAIVESVPSVYSVENHPNDSRVGINEGGKVQALTGRMGTGGGNVPMVMQCYSKSKRAQSATDNETWVESETANTLNAFDVGDVRTTEAVVMEAYQHHGYRESDVLGTLTAGQNGGVRGDTPLVCYSVDQGGGKSSVDVREDKAPTLTTTHDGAPAVCYSTNHGSFHTLADEGICATLQASDYKDPPTCCYAVDCRNGTEDSINGALQSNSAHSLNGNNVVRTHYIVRRLTPLECERLQGYPDGWTDIGDWVDSNGKKRQTSDAARYKALGNSIALPPWKWVLKRLCACYERDATMASLFDGIGGFPYRWEQLNGKGTCLWASEIEEFPMAVTKVRIGDDT